MSVRAAHSSTRELPEFVRVKLRRMLDEARDPDALLSFLLWIRQWIRQEQRRRRRQATVK
jgi:hypothetical protein